MPTLLLPLGQMRRGKLASLIPSVISRIFLGSSGDCGTSGIERTFDELWSGCSARIASWREFTRKAQQGTHRTGSDHFDEEVLATKEQGADACVQHSAIWV